MNCFLWTSLHCFASLFEISLNNLLEIVSCWTAKRLRLNPEFSVWNVLFSPEVSKVVSSFSF
jgi:hypothetical protein